MSSEEKLEVMNTSEEKKRDERKVPGEKSKQMVMMDKTKKLEMSHPIFGRSWRGSRSMGLSTGTGDPERSNQLFLIEFNVTGISRAL